MARHNRAVRNLDAQFAAAAVVGFRMPIANLATTATILANVQTLEAQQTLSLTQKAWMQLDK